MGRKIYKEIKQENGTVTIYGSNRAIQIRYAVPEWSDGDAEEYFMYEGRRMYLSQFSRVHNNYWAGIPPEWLKEFDGYITDTFFSGVAVKYVNEESCGEQMVKAFTFIS